ncbi:MAG: cysteine--tRNA ligase [Patescibacteria group bacterium]|nr:cysteine--tRNA ligase [Patescibacteria group bacterium]
MIKIYSSLTRKKEYFVPLSEGELKMYACGITPYDEIHIGHARQAVVYDVIRAYFEYLGYKIIYVRNWTDVDDKIIKRANKEGIESMDVSEHYIKENLGDLEKLKVKHATYEPKVTDCITDIIEYIQVLINKGFAYVIKGEVFFDIDKFTEYGKLSNRKREDLINSEESINKKNNNDFVLWKPRKPDEPYWDSPWSKGRPGWHIECSVMAHKYLGDEIDIHGGGLDLIFPHHENELAQSEAYSGKTFAKYWVHNGLVMINGTKMSKSLGNFLTVKDALKKYFPEEIRYVILTHNYSSDIDFSDDLFLNARKRLYYFYTTLLRMEEFANGADDKVDSDKVPIIITNFEGKFNELMDDNFNTPRVISEITEIFKELNKVIDSNKYSTEEKSDIFKFFFQIFNKISSVLRLFEDSPNEYLSKLKEKILTERNLTEDFISLKLEERQSAKKVKDYKKADSIKEELKLKGVSIQDSSDSVKWEIIFQ